MAQIRNLRRSFGGGEVTPEFFGRVDDATFQTGVATMRNFIALPHGPARNRPGLAFVNAVKDESKKVRLIPFTFNADQTLAIEVGAGYFRFHTQGATLLSGGVPYEVPNSYAESDLFDIHYVQSSDVLTLTHPRHPPSELRRRDVVDWEFLPIDFDEPASPPLGVVATAFFPPSELDPDGPVDPDTFQDWNYKVTSVVDSPDGNSAVRESGASAVATASNNLFVTGARNTISWNAVAGVDRYRVYKELGGLYGFIGETETTSITDDNIEADVGRTPPVYDGLFERENGILSLAVVDGGSGYVATVQGGGFQSVDVRGSDLFNSADLALVVTDPTGTGAQFAVTTRNISGRHEVAAVDVVAPGDNYTDPTFFIVAPGEARRVFYGFEQTPITARPPTIQIQDTTGAGAVLEAVVNGAGQITAINVLEPGDNYSLPSATVVSDTGTGADLGDPVLGAVSDNPGAVSYFEQRRCLAGTPLRPQNVFMTRPGTESDFGRSIPVKDDDRIAFRVASRESNRIRHMVPLGSLILLTASAEWRVASVNADAITPTSLSVKPQSYVGANNVQPLVINNSLLYAAARGGHVREMAFNFQASGFVTGDLSLRAPHLFDHLQIVDMTYAKAPQPICWFVSSNGDLLGLTYIPDQQVGAWHRHDTAGGVFESCCTVQEGDEDAVYVIVQRIVAGVPRRFVERMTEQDVESVRDAFHVDSGLTYCGPAVSSVAGLDHLEGMRVSILADGAVHPDQVVTGGAVPLESPATMVHVGLPIESDLETLPVAAQVDGGLGQGRLKNVNKVWIRVYRSSGMFVGPDADHLVEAKQRTTEPPGTPPRLVDDEVEVVLTPSWADNGHVFIRQRAPLPLTLVSLTMEVSMGG